MNEKEFEEKYKKNITEAANTFIQMNSEKFRKDISEYLKKDKNDPTEFSIDMSMEVLQFCIEYIDELSLVIGDMLVDKK